MRYGLTNFEYGSDCKNDNAAGLYGDKMRNLPSSVATVPTIRGVVFVAVGVR
jgi:hypothetical protein